MNLFIIYVGGKHTGSFIELHDMRFVAANTLEETYEFLRKSWWGTPESLHIDAWGILKHVDGYEIHLKNEPQAEIENKLFFVNLGGYDENEFTELHKNIFVVAPTESKAKVKALKQILDWKGHHRDYQYDVEEVLNVEEILIGKKLHLHLGLSDKEIPFEFICRYMPINKKGT